MQQVLGKTRQLVGLCTQWRRAQEKASALAGTLVNLCERLKVLHLATEAKMPLFQHYPDALSRALDKHFDSCERVIGAMNMLIEQEMQKVTSSTGVNIPHILLSWLMICNKWRLICASPMKPILIKT